MSIELTGAPAPRLFPEAIESSARSWLTRAVGCGLVAFAAMSWLGLLSWSAIDPIAPHAGATAGRNLLGPTGAAISDLLLQTLGIAAVFALIAPMIWGLELVTAQRLPGIRLKAVLFPFALLALAGACSGIPTLQSWPLHHGFGGMLGDLVFNMTGTLTTAVSAERSGLLAGLALSTVGLTLLAYSLGLDAGTLDRVVLRTPQQSASTPAALWEFVPATLNEEPKPTAPVDTDRATAKAPAAPAPLSRSRLPVDVDDNGPQLPLPLEMPSDRAPAASDNHAPDIDARSVAERFAPKTKAAKTKKSRSATTGEPGIARQLPFGIGRQRGYRKPSLNLLKHGPGDTADAAAIHATAEDNARLLQAVLEDFGVEGQVRDIRPGPVVTRYEFEPRRGIKSQRIISLADDIARSMSARAVRVSVVPGRNTIGVEVPNDQREMVCFREILESDTFRSSPATLPLALGRGIGGETVVADLARMPHLLIAGTTGSGKSVGINTMILSLIYKLDPTECRLLMIDPKMLELSTYNGIPHLLAPVVTDVDQAAEVLDWAVGEMEERYKRMATLGVRNIETFNIRVRNAQRRGQPLQRSVQTGFDERTGEPVYASQSLALEPMPFIVIVIDELADLMLTAGNRVEGALQRLAQMARAAGIHLIVATQRPSVDVVTGTIKANFPMRLSFRVASKIDSRTIINEHGAEQLLGQGDMLLSGGAGRTLRVHGAFVGEDEVEAVAEALRGTGAPQYDTAVADATQSAAQASPVVSASPAEVEETFQMAVAVVLRDRKVSAGHLYRRLGIAQDKGERFIARMEQDGIVGPVNLFGRRRILRDTPPAPRSHAVA